MVLLYPPLAYLLYIAHPPALILLAEWHYLRGTTGEQGGEKSVTLNGRSIPTRRMKLSLTLMHTQKSITGQNVTTLLSLKHMHTQSNRQVLLMYRFRFTSHLFSALCVHSQLCATYSLWRES